jgi:Putative peptidoglycan binding domain
MRLRTTSIAALLPLLLVAAPGADARPRAPHVSWVRCMAKCTDKRTVAPQGTVKLAGRRLPRGGKVMFPIRLQDGTRTTRGMRPKSANAARIVVAVPKTARSGRLFVKKGRVRSNSSAIRIRKLPPPSPTPAPAPTTPPPTGTAFDGGGMWIWYVSKANGGDTNAIVQQAQAHGVTTVFVKSGDGTNYWSQFTPALVEALHAGGLRVCAWQYVYGDKPGPEAAVAARAVTEAGADCFVIDAESEYEGRYAQAQTYIEDLRAAVGPDYPIGLAGFPYVDYHPSYPYSVFLGPNGAQFNAPQAYWKEIGGGVDAVVDHTYRFNRPYGRTIAPLGQTYDSPPSSEIVRFRQLSAAEGATGLSWWSWQHTSTSGWDAVGQAIDPLTTAPAPEFALLAKGAKGDLVVWAQQHLRGAGATVAVDGDFGPATESAVKSFQSGAALPASGKIDTPTWQALLQHAPAKKNWRKAAAPKNAKLPAKRYEITPSSGFRATR